MRSFLRRTSRIATACLALGMFGTTALAQPQPLNLRGGATPTGLWGYYDFQSNGMSPAWLRVEPGDPQRLHVVYMLALNGTDTTVISSSRRVGYSLSTDGGQTWNATREIEALRLGFPYLQVLPDRTPLIAAHGAPVSGQPMSTLFYIGTPNGTSFFRAGEFPAATASGRIGDQAGVIWPAFVVNPMSPNPNAPEGIFLGSLSFRTGEGPAPLQWAKTELGVGVAWRDFADSSIAATSGGRYVIATSPGGKIGVVTRSFGTIDLSGIYFSESTDGGTTWSQPTKIFGFEFTDEYMFNGDQDTIAPGVSVDLAYRGEEPHVVMSGQRAARYSHQGIFHWSPTTGLQTITLTDSTRALGLLSAVALKAQPGMDYIDYPSISIGNDGEHIVVPFMAAAQTSSEFPDQVTSPDGFYYFRLWGIGSPDGGKTWGTPFLLQDFAGDGTDSASIEYPSANETGRMIDGNFELSLAFQARRFPGMYSFINENIDGNNTPADRGPVGTPVFQYFQRTMLGPDKFEVEPTSVGEDNNAMAGLAFTRSFPNPASTHLSIEYTLPTSGDVTLELFNTLGDKALTAVDGERGYAGTHTRTLDLSGLPAGPYRLVLTLNGKSTSQPVSVVR